MSTILSKKEHFLWHFQGRTLGRILARRRNQAGIRLNLPVLDYSFLTNTIILRKKTANIVNITGYKIIVFYKMFQIVKYSKSCYSKNVVVRKFVRSHHPTG